MARTFSAEITAVSRFPAILIRSGRGLCRGPLALRFEEWVGLGGGCGGGQKRRSDLGSPWGASGFSPKFAPRLQYLSGPAGGATALSFPAFQRGC